MEHPARRCQAEDGPRGRRAATPTGKLQHGLPVATSGDTGAGLEAVQPEPVEVNTGAESYTLEHRADEKQQGPWRAAEPQRRLGGDAQPA